MSWGSQKTMFNLVMYGAICSAGTLLASLFLDLERRVIVFAITASVFGLIAGLRWRVLARREREARESDPA